MKKILGQNSRRERNNERNLYYGISLWAIAAFVTTKYSFVFRYTNTLSPILVFSRRMVSTLRLYPKVIVTNLNFQLIYGSFTINTKKCSLQRNCPEIYEFRILNFLHICISKNHKTSFADSIVTILFNFFYIDLKYILLYT